MQLKKVYWWWRAESKALALWYLGRIPLNLGVWIRERALRRYFREFGPGNKIGDNFRVTNPENVSMGSHCAFADSIHITAGGGVTIGSYVGLGPGVKIWSVNHRYQDPDVPWLKQGYDRAPVVIEDDAWLGANCFVMPGVTIGKGAILSAGTVLMKSVPAYAIVAGNPGRVIGWRKRPEGLAEGKSASDGS